MTSATLQVSDTTQTPRQPFKRSINRLKSKSAFQAYYGSHGLSSPHAACNGGDFVVYGSEGFCAIEVKHSSSVRARDLRPLKAFGEDYPEASLRLIYRGTDRLEIDGILCLPCDEYLKKIIPGSKLP